MWQEKVLGGGKGVYVCNLVLVWGAVWNLVRGFGYGIMAIVYLLM